jgi:hypothetical protein
MSIVILNNPDKKRNETWTPGRDLMNFPCPSRICMCGKPNSGKTNAILNILLKADPKYEKIYLLHPALLNNDGDDDDDADECKVPEYKHIDYEPLYEIPAPTFFKTNSGKTMLIIDDVELKTIDKIQKKRLNKVVSYASSHYNMTIIISTQDSFSTLPPCVLRFCNVFILWRFNDLLYMKMLLNRAGVAKKTAERVIEEMEQYTLHDNFCIDATLDSPAKYRKNFYLELQL